MALAVYMTEDVKVYFICKLYIQSVSEIGGQTLRAYSTCCKDEKSHINMGPEMLQTSYVALYTSPSRLQINTNETYFLLGW